MSQHGKRHLDKRLARLAAVQACYRHDLDGTPFNVIIKEFINSGFQQILDEAPVEMPDIELFRHLVEAIAKRLEDVDNLISQHLAVGWSLPRLEKVALAILRIGSVELYSRPETAAVIVVCEYADIAHAFFDDKDAGFVNGMLNRLARIVRSEEFEAHGSHGPE